MAKWIRFEQGGKTSFGTLEGDRIAVHTGDLFAGALAGDLAAARFTGSSVAGRALVAATKTPSVELFFWRRRHAQPDDVSYVGCRRRLSGWIFAAIG